MKYKVLISWLLVFLNACKYWGQFHKELGLVLGDITNLRLVVS